MDAVPPVPSRPRSALRNLDPTKRHTFSAESTIIPPTRRSSTRVPLQSASSEVISSLISSLSTISTPAEAYFDASLPQASARSAPTSPVVGSAKDGVDTLSLNSRVPGGETGSNKNMVSNGFLHPDDAAISPVIRTSKPPSGFSPLTAPKRRSQPSSPTASRATSGIFDHFGPLSIGNLTVEPGPSRASSVSAHSEGSGKPRSQKSLDVKSSKEKMREMDKDRKRRSKGFSQDGVQSPHGIFKDATEQPSPGPALNGLSESLEDSTKPDAEARLGHAIESANAALDELDGSYDATGENGNGRNIPTRESSLRHSTGSTSSRRNRRSYRPSHVPSEIHIERPKEEARAEYDIIVPSPTDDSVTRRIKELKAQKEEREKSWYSDDEGQRETAKIREPKKKVPLGRSSLPAPSTKPKIDINATEMPARILSNNTAGASAGAGAETTPLEIGRTRSLNSQISAKRYVPPAPAFEKHARTFSNPLGTPRRSMQVEDRASIADSIDDAVRDYLTAPRLSQIIYHPQTGRAISFSEVGDPEGSVVFCCVGMGTTRFLTAFYDELATTLKLRLITPDRPGIGNSESCPEGSDTPLAWPDDIRAICSHLGISRFSILAHSAGSIYALATALRMPQHIRGRIHLLAPWIPPSQMVAIGISQERVPVTSLPYSQRILRSLPTPFLKAANSSFFSITSTSITTSIQKSPKRMKRRSLTAETFEPTDPPKAPRSTKHSSYAISSDSDPKSPGIGAPSNKPEPASAAKANPSKLTGKDRQTEYDMRLTQGIWEAATTNANPAVDLLVCLERRQEIGFRYVDITKRVVIHHGSRDSRVPLENVKWLDKMMRNCEIRVLEGEGHGLMASAAVMGNVLSEMAKEWEDWIAVTRRGRSENKKMH